MTPDEVRDVLRGMDWTGIHKVRVFSDYGDSVVLFTDGDFAVQEQSTHYRDPDAAGVIGYLSCWGIGNVDETSYFEGFVERADDRGKWVERSEEDVTYRHVETGEELDGDAYVEIETGRVLTEDEAFTEAIEAGDWDYEEDIDAFMRRYEEDAAYRA